MSERAAQALFSNVALLARVSPEAAEHLAAEFEKAANSLRDLPKRCPWITEEYFPRNAYRFILFEERYMLVFQVVDGVVYADYVLDCRQDYGWLIH